MKSIQHALESLRDIEGIYGSAVLSDDGDLLLSDLPEELTERLSVAAPRLARLRDAMAMTEGDEVAGCRLRFERAKLAMIAVAGGLLVVMSAVTVNEAALRTGMQLVRRRIPPGEIVRETTTVSESAVPPTVRATPGPAVSEAAPDIRVAAGAPESGESAPLRKARTVVFRGKKIS